MTQLFASTDSKCCTEMHKSLQNLYNNAASNFKFKNVAQIFENFMYDTNTCKHRFIMMHDVAQIFANEV